MIAHETHNLKPHIRAQNMHETRFSMRNLALKRLLYFALSISERSKKEQNEFLKLKMPNTTQTLSQLSSMFLE